MDKRKRKDFTVKQKLDLLRLQEIAGTSNRAFATQHGIDEGSVRRWKTARLAMEATQADRNVSERVVRRLPGAGSRPKFQALEKDLNAWVLARNNAGLHVKEKLIKLQAANLKAEMIKELHELITVNDDELREMQERHERDIVTITHLSALANPSEAERKELAARESANRIRIEQLEGMNTLGSSYSAKIKELHDFQVSNSWLKGFRDRHQLVSRRHTTTHKYPDDFAKITSVFE